MRVSAFVLVAALLAGAAQAQVVSPLAGSTGTPARTDAAAPAPAVATPAARPRRTMAVQFEAANTTHDGHLTLAQAKAAHMNAAARDFAEIDKEHRGYITLDDIREHAKAKRAARKAALAQ